MKGGAALPFRLLGGRSNSPAKALSLLLLTGTSALVSSIANLASFTTLSSPLSRRRQTASVGVPTLPPEAAAHRSRLPAFLFVARQVKMLVKMDEFPHQTLCFSNSTSILSDSVSGSGGIVAPSPSPKSNVGVYFLGPLIDFAYARL